MKYSSKTWAITLFFILHLLVSTTTNAKKATKSSKTKSVVHKSKSSERQIAYIFINPIKYVGTKGLTNFKPGKSKGKSHSSRSLKEYGYLEDVFINIITNVLKPVPDLNVRNYRTSKAVADNLKKYKKIEKMDKITLIALKNKTGIDGLIYGNYGVKSDGTVLGTIFFVDLNNGRVFRKRTLNFKIGSKLFNTIEGDTLNFGKSVRASYSVTLNIDAKPDKCDIIINGKKHGVTPKIIELDEGKYRVEVRKGNYKAYKKEFFFKEGEKIKIDTVLYNPIADSYLNKPPGFRIDRLDIGMGYAFAYVDNKEPEFANLNMFMMYLSTRIPGNIDIGMMFFFTGWEGSNKFDTFLNRSVSHEAKEGLISEYLLFTQWNLFEKLSFASAHIGGGFGFSRITSHDPDVSSWEKRKYSWAGNAYIGGQSVLIRGSSLGIAVRLDVGYNYIGELEYKKKEANLFGKSKSLNEISWVGGLYAALSLDIIYWYGIF